MFRLCSIVLFIFYLYYLSRDPMFLIINAIILVGLVTTAVGTAMQRREQGRFSRASARCFDADSGPETTDNTGRDIAS